MFSNMSLIKENEKQRRLKEAFKIPWIKSSLLLGGIFIIMGAILIVVFKIFNFSGSQFILDVKAFIESYGLIGIFLVTVLAGTVIPVGSPALVVAAASFGLNPIPLILMATTGFTLGMVINYGLAYSLGRPYVLKKVGSERLEEISNLWSRWGWIIYTIFGLIPFLPVEFLSLFCGLLKTRFDIFLALTFIPRLLVFTLLAYFGNQLGWWLGII